MSFNSRTVKASQTTIVALNTVVAGTTAGGPALSVAGTDPENGSIVANVSVASTTSTITILPKWQVSQDNVTWTNLKLMNTPAEVTVAAAGSGSLVTTTYAQTCPINPPYPYVRLAVVTGAATGGAGDNVTISYNYRKRAE